MIGPNSILQTLPALIAHIGEARTAQIRKAARIDILPDGSGLIPQEQAARLHRAVRELCPDEAAKVLGDAGRRTADYLLAHRIPRPVQALLRLLPAPLAAAILSRAIARNAWTFAGSGRFRRVDPWTFELAGNPLIAGEHGPEPLCAWHCAVFERLYAVLVHRDCRCVEIECAARNGGPCIFAIGRDRTALRSPAGR